MPLKRGAPSRFIGGYSMDSLEDVVNLLRHRRRHDLAKLLSQATVEFFEIDEASIIPTGMTVVIGKVEICAPIFDYDLLRSLSKQDNHHILEAVQEIWPYEEREGGMAINQIGYRLDQSSLRDESYNADALIQQLDRLRNTMISVSTGGPRIDEVNAEYKEVYNQLTEELETWGLQNPIPYTDLWDWYGKWSSGDLPSYQSRREYIRDLCAPLEKRLREGPSSRGAEVFSEPTGWHRVDRTLGEVRTQLEASSTEEQFQTVGLLCRETLISLAQTVFDPNQHPPIDQVEASDTDAKRMLERYLAREVAGRSNATARKHARVSLNLANELQHKRTATFRDAALCAEATASVVNIIAILSGIRDPQGTEAK